MASVAFKTVYLFFALVALPQVLAGPGCARRHYGKPDCVEKCKARWGSDGHYMGGDKWGSVIKNGSGQDTDLDSIISAACGLHKTTTTTTTTPDDEPTPPNKPPCQSSKPPKPPVQTEDPSTHTPPGPNSPPLPPPTHSPPPSSSPPQHPPPPNTYPPPPATTDEDHHTHYPSSSPPKPTTTPDSPPTDSFATEALSGHNSFRALHGASALTWNKTLADAAKRWVSGCVFKHSGGKVGPYGENLGAGSGQYTVTDAINGWTAEAKDYNPQNPIYSHFTQVVWKNTKQLGCAVVTCPAGSIFDAKYGSAQFVACEYDPPGNYIGQFGPNVQV